MGSESRSLTYREKDVDSTLDEHDRRISRLEKAAWVGAGYVVAEFPNIASNLIGLV